MESLIFFCIALNLIPTGLSQTVSYYPDGLLSPGDEAVISCYAESKPLGPTNWVYGSSNTVYTNLCGVVISDGILEERSDCYGDTSANTEANFTFTITSLDWNRDTGNNSWKCLMYPNPKPLDIKMKIGINETRYTNKPTGVVERKTSTSITVETSCHFPVEEVAWCLQRSNEETVKCSDEDSQFYKDVFEDGLDIQQTSTICENYQGGEVKKVSSTLSGTTEKKRIKNADIKLFAKVNGTYIETDAVVIQLQGVTTGEAVGIGISVIIFIILIIIVIILLVKKCSNESSGTKM